MGDRGRGDWCVGSLLSTPHLTPWKGGGMNWGRGGCWPCVGSVARGCRRGKCEHALGEKPRCAGIEGHGIYYSPKQYLKPSASRPAAPRSPSSVLAAPLVRCCPLSRKEVLRRTRRATPRRQQRSRALLHTVAIAQECRSPASERAFLPARTSGTRPGQGDRGGLWS